MEVDAINRDIDIVENQIEEYDSKLLKLLLTDKTTKGYIKWATDNYKHLGAIDYAPDKEIKPHLITGTHTRIIQPRVAKSKEEQISRTKDKGEVFTPVWVCNFQNNLIDEAWFGQKDVFNIADGKSWKVNTNRIEFCEDKTWQEYVTKAVLEITCGEAPYLVSRYGVVTGRIIEIKDRIGLLDRKIRVVNENTDTEQEWLEWVYKAFKGTYGYEYQGDNVLIARENLLATFIDYYTDRFNKEPKRDYLHQIAKIICWNIWQMDGLTNTVPFSSNIKKEVQPAEITLFEEFSTEQTTKEIKEPVKARIFDWEKNCSLEFASLLKKKG